MRDYYQIIRPLLLLLDAEKAHRLAILAAKHVPLFGQVKPDDPILNCSVWGLKFTNPIGLAAGADKDAEVCDRFQAIIGSGFVEIGTVTPLPQKGNVDKSRLYTLFEDEAVINRLGFPSHGLERIKKRLQSRKENKKFDSILGANIGINFGCVEPEKDFQKGIKELCNLVDYFAINVSSPNTPGLRLLQEPNKLKQIILSAQETRFEVANIDSPPILLKIAPDLTKEELGAISDVALSTKIDGLVVSNTTVQHREGLRSRFKNERGGLSGRPLFEPSTLALKEIFRCTEGKIPLIGVGGVSSGRDAYTKIRAGASLVQLYTSLIYRGRNLVRLIKKDLADLLRRDGFSHVLEAVGADVGTESDSLRHADIEKKSLSEPSITVAPQERQFVNL